MEGDAVVVLAPWGARSMPAVEVSRLFCNESCGEICQGCQEHHRKCLKPGWVKSTGRHLGVGAHLNSQMDGSVSVFWFKLHNLHWHQKYLHHLLF